MRRKKIVQASRLSRRTIFRIFPDLLRFKNQTIIIIILVLSGSVFAQQDSLNNESQYYIVSVMPSFIGGEKKLKDFIDKRKIYTQNAYNEKIEGKIYISFDVEIDGNLSNIRIVKGLHKDLDSIGISIVKSMPNWKPAMKDTIPIKRGIILPIEFAIDKKTIKRSDLNKN